MQRIVIALACVALAGCQLMPDGSRRIDVAKAGAYAAAAWGLVKEYRDYKAEDDAEAEAAQAATWNDRIKLGRVAAYAAQYRQTHPDDDPMRAVESAALWYQLNYGEPISALISRLYGPSANDEASDLDIILQMVNDRVE